MAIRYKAKRFLRGLQKEFNPREPFIKKAESRNINNLWTGRELGGKGKILAGAGILGMGGYQISNVPEFRVLAQSDTEDIQSIPGTRGDMVGYTANIGNETGLQVSGDLVFALHKLRNGG